MGGPGRARLESRVRDAENRAIVHMEREADGLPVVAPRDELAQDLDVVVPGVKEALVEGLLERHHHRRDRTRSAPSQAPLQHWTLQRAGRKMSIPRPETRCAKSSAKR
jgi:hypothetical protein